MKTEEIEELIDTLEHPEHQSSYSADGGWTDSELDACAAAIRATGRDAQ